MCSPSRVMAMIQLLSRVTSLNGILWSIGVFLIILLVLWYGSTPGRLPPGPYGLPFLGCIPYLQVVAPQRILAEWIKKYGPVMSFYMAGQLVVVLSDRRVLEETLVRQSEAYAGRPPILLPQPKRIRKGHGLITADGDLWKEQRRFAARTMRDFCLPHLRSAFEKSLYAEVRRLCSRISTAASAHGQQPIDLYHSIATSASGIMGKMLFGRSFEDERSLQAQVDRINYRNTSSNVHPLSAILYLPWLIKLPILREGMKKFLREGDEIAEFFQDRIDETAATFQSDKTPTNYVHAFMRAAENGLGEYFTNDQLLPAVFQLFVGGTETITTTLRWALYIMAKHSAVQSDVFEEINSKIRGDPKKEDMQNLPLTQATLMEVMRVATILPMSAMHRTTRKTLIDGYVIPADTCVIPFLNSVHMDEEAFPEPRKFDPNRFIYEDGKLRTSCESWIPYSLGKRACPAISLAKVELFVILASLIQMFEFSFEENTSDRSVDDCVLGFSQSPPMSRFIVRKRDTR